MVTLQGPVTGPGAEQVRGTVATDLEEQVSGLYGILGPEKLS